MKHKLRCKECGRFIRNGWYCQRCVKDYENWLIGMRNMNYPNDNESGRLVMIEHMKRMCEQ